MIPAAGLGTRFLPATKAVPKEMLPIVDTPTIQLVIDEAVRAGITDVVVINGRNKYSIEDHFDHAYELERTLADRGKTELLEAVKAVSTMVRLISVRQKQPMGLGHAVLCAREAVGNESFAVLLGDDLIDNDRDPGIAQLIRAHEATGAGVVSVMEVPEGQEHLYGIVSGTRDAQGRMRIEQMVEKPKPGTAPSRWAIVGRYVLPPSIFDHLATTKPGAGGEIQLTDALKQLASSKEGLYGVVVDGTRHDAGDKLGYLRANLAYALKRPELRDDVIALCREMAATASGSTGR
ncbi:MAG TPA: UTP--glucose-1-phosphate uridylyltransferase GalU [Kofleriaceae bacterium]|nr:UTP--glucose-1-phosphate uridylyltransferase GalU [Kofleriaceae bacterium]